MPWTIEAKVLPLPGLAGHLYIEVFDDAGARVLQINGLATHPKTQQTRSVGLPGDVLKAYVGMDFVLGASEGATRDHHPHKGRVLFRGSQQDVMKAIKAAEAAREQINHLKLPYRVLKLNSNSVFMHMVEAMAAVVPVDPKAVEDMRHIRPLLPGIDTKHLKQAFQKAGQRVQQRSAKNPKPKF